MLLPKREPRGRRPSVLALFRALLKDAATSHHVLQAARPADQTAKATTSGDGEAERGQEWGCHSDGIADCLRHCSFHLSRRQPPYYTDVGGRGGRGLRVCVGGGGGAWGGGEGSRTYRRFLL